MTYLIDGDYSRQNKGLLAHQLASDVVAVVIAPISSLSVPTFKDDGISKIHALPHEDVRAYGLEGLPPGHAWGIKRPGEKETAAPRNDSLIITCNPASVYLFEASQRLWRGPQRNDSNLRMPGPVPNNVREFPFP